MLRKPLLFIVISLSFILYGDGKAIEDRNFQSNIIDSASRIQNRHTNENLKFKAAKSERLSEKAITRSTCIGDCNEKNPKVLTESKQLCPYENKELCLIFSLSKIAKVQVGTLNQVSTHDNLRLNTFGGTSNARNSKINEEVKEKEDLSFDFGNRNEEGYFRNFSEKQMKSSYVHCRAVRDVYIPEVKQNLPAFACKFENSTFILSSEKFLEDRRSYLDIRIDENTARNIKFTPKVSRSNKFNAIPALLILNVANNNYRIEMPKNISKEEKIDRGEKNR